MAWFVGTRVWTKTTGMSCSSLLKGLSLAVFPGSVLSRQGNYQGQEKTTAACNKYNAVQLKMGCWWVASNKYIGCMQATNYPAAIPIG
jgi:hypothetical protein